MIWFFYNVSLVLSAPFWVPWMLWRSRKRQTPPNWKERSGEYQIPRRRDRKRIWVHAVSVGEVNAARPLLKHLRELSPDYELVLTSTTSTGYSIAKDLVGTEVEHLFYFPIDVPRFCVAAMTRIEPSVVVIMETELWLNFLSAAKVVQAKTCLANGRISERSFKRARFFRPFYRALLKNMDRCLMQTQTDAQRISALGAKNVEVLGNTKFDEDGSHNTDLDWPAELPAFDRLVVAGSIRGQEEEDFVLQALTGIDAQIIFAPRHVERAAAIAQRAATLGFSVGFRTRGDKSKFLILDTYGELAAAYSHADVAIIGGGFSRQGGQNFIQAMAAGCPVVCGPHMGNFQQAFDAALVAGALRVAHDAGELREAVAMLLSDKRRAEEMGEAGRKLVQENRGAAKRYAMAVAALARDFEAEQEARNR